MVFKCGGTFKFGTGFSNFCFKFYFNGCSENFRQFFSNCPRIISDFDLWRLWESLKNSNRWASLNFFFLKIYAHSGSEGNTFFDPSILQSHEAFWINIWSWLIFAIQDLMNTLSRDYDPTFLSHFLCHPTADDPSLKIFIFHLNFFHLPMNNFVLELVKFWVRSWFESKSRKWRWSAFSKNSPEKLQKKNKNALTDHRSQIDARV